MKRVFSRWPSQAGPSVLAEADGEASIPLWMSAPLRPFSRRHAGAILTSLLIVLLPIGLAFGAGLALAGRLELLAPLLSLAAVATLGACVLVARLQLRRLRAEALHDAVFERAGISMWREDWSAAAQEVAALRERGITDIEAHFAGRPEQLRSLCAKVLIRDVNGFTVEEAGAPGKESFIGPLDRLLPHTDRTFVQWLMAFARGDRFFRSEAHITMPDGSVLDTLFAAALPTEFSGFSDVIVTSLDITAYKGEQVKLRAVDAEIARASRISTVGALSASIAHEVNSPLAAALANAQAALRWLQRSDPNVPDAIEAVSAVVSDAKRARDVVARTRAFIANAPVSVARFDAISTARDAIMLVEQELRALGAAVHLQAERNLPAALGDVIQVQQVMTNLLLNAAQAMAPQSTAKEITVSLRKDGDLVCVEIADTGPGIDPQNLERVFNPFYTTKPDGMGMGLAICRNSIASQGGHIWATTAASGGAVVHFALPLDHA